MRGSAALQGSCSLSVSGAGCGSDPSISSVDCGAGPVAISGAGNGLFLFWEQGVGWGVGSAAGLFRRETRPGCGG
eukprot:scaffold3871_cov97-Isochrysis_galbana.AAC.14